nr:immunoglobulin heavy chain junction region [Mus musculus]
CAGDGYYDYFDYW